MSGAEQWLVGTTEHSVLGRRWVYDGCADPVYAAALAEIILAGGSQAEECFERDGRVERRAPLMTVASDATAPTDLPALGSLQRLVDDDPTLIVLDHMDLAVVRRLECGTLPTGVTLTGTWPGQVTPVPLAAARPRSME